MTPTEGGPTSASNKKAAKKDEDRVVKRPARGYHRFRNGIINVTPKGEEKELVKNNQNSPLLRLPPELRGRIWELVFGVYVLRTVYRTYDRRSKDHRLMPPVTKRKNSLALLRACRQIYAETALLPYKSSIFSTTFGAALKPRLQSLKSFQRAQIEEIQFEVLITRLSTRERLRSMVNQLDVKKLAILPGLKRVGICVFCPKHISESQSEYKSRLKKCRRIIRKETGRRLAGKDIRIMAGSSKQNWRNYHLKWY